MTQQDALEILKRGYSTYITGAAGSGKTYLLNEFVRYLKKRGVGIGVTATTGIAATHLGGLTIHSWSGIGVAREMNNDEIEAVAARQRIAGRFTKADTLIIDEISMLDADRLSLVNRVAKSARRNSKPFGGMQVVLCGDFFQLPPVARSGEPSPQFAYRSLAWKELDPKICYLTQQFRQGEDVLLGILNAIRRARVDVAVRNKLCTRCSAAAFKGRITKLYSHNVDVDAENLRELDALPGKKLIYRMEFEGIPTASETLKNGCLAPEELVVKKDAMVMFVKNNFEKGYVNGTIGVITGFGGDGYPLVKTLSGRTIAATPENWTVEDNGRVLAKICQVPLRLAWAVTIHKSQGMTLDSAEINLADAFEAGMGYVALSRVRSLAGIRLLGLNNIALKVHPDILAFDAELRRQSEAFLCKFHDELRQKNVGNVGRKKGLKLIPLPTSKKIFRQHI